jgi:hypothetical protein
VHLPPLQARPAGQSVATEQPHAPATHAVPFTLPAQSMHADAEPHAVGRVPIMHVPIEPPQQKPAPHPPPSQSALHPPATQVGVAPGQVVQASPPLPHSEEEEPITHVPAVLQHPPLQRSPPVHDVEHRPLVGSHASPTRQSFAVVHP